jgi:hypothetical protein
LTGLTWLAASVFVPHMLSDKQGALAMQWYWYALAAGVVAPPIVYRERLRSAFASGGMTVGLGTWFGMSIVTTAISFVLFWLAVTFGGL